MSEANIIIDNLIHNGILRSYELNDDEEALLKIINEFKVNGWNDSISYHFSTIDYPFIDYSTQYGHVIDKERMEKYYIQENEMPRYKSYTSTETVKGNSPYETCFSDEGSTKDNVMGILSFALGKLYENNSQKLRTPTFRKVLPSGGARHPTEAYLIASSNIKNLAPGVYHYNSNDYMLSNLNVPCNDNKIEELFFSYQGYIGFKPSASIILTSVFERNMFRYREPRTFRSIYIDAGHILTVMNSLAKKLHITHKYQHNYNQKAIENFLNLSPFEEGVMAIIHLR